MDDGDRVDAVGAVLPDGVVPPADLVLQVEPALVVARRGRVEDPLPEALAHLRQVARVGLAGLRVAEVAHELRRGRDEAVPDVEHVLDLRAQDLERHAQGLDVVVSEEQGLLEPAQLLEGHGGGRQRARGAFDLHRRGLGRGIGRQGRGVGRRGAGCRAERDQQAEPGSGAHMLDSKMKGDVEVETSE